MAGGSASRHVCVRRVVGHAVTRDPPLELEEVAMDITPVGATTSPRTARVEGPVPLAPVARVEAPTPAEPRAREREAPTPRIA